MQVPFPYTYKLECCPNFSVDASAFMAASHQQIVLIAKIEQNISSALSFHYVFRLQNYGCYVMAVAYGANGWVVNT